MKQFASEKPKQTTTKNKQDSNNKNNKNVATRQKQRLKLKAKFNPAYPTTLTHSTLGKNFTFESSFNGHREGEREG